MLVSIPTKHNMKITNIILVFHQMLLCEQLWRKKKSKKNLSKLNYQFQTTHNKLHFNKKKWSALFESLPVLSLLSKEHEDLFYYFIENFKINLKCLDVSYIFFELVP